MKRLVLFFILSLGFSGVASASPIIISIGTDEGLVSPGRDNQGWWSDTTINSNANNDNYLTGNYEGRNFHSYFTFDLSGLGLSSITGLTLDLRRYIQTADVNIRFWNVTTSATDLASRGALDAAIFNDLGSGTSYGDAMVTQGFSTDVLSFVLNANAVADANAAIGGYFSIGVSLFGASMDERIFSASAAEPGNGGPGFTQRLVITNSQGVQPVPVPAPVALLALGLVALKLTRRRRNA